MNTTKLNHSIIALILLIGLVCSFTVQGADDNNIKSLEGFPEASLTIFPTTYHITGPKEKHREFYDRMMSPAGREYFKKNDILPLLLEEKGYDNFKTSDTFYRFPEEDDAREDRGAAFSKFVSGQNLKTDFAICTEITAHLEEGIQEVYTVITDVKGKVVWENCWNRGDPDFEAEYPETPQKCCEFVVKRITPVMGLDKLPPKELSEEKKNVLGNMRLGEPPDKPEIEAMEKRLEILKATKGKARVMVYPTRVQGERVDKASAERLCKMLNENDLCQARIAEASPVLKGAGWPDESKVLWVFSKAVKEYVKANPPTDCDYVLFADYWMRPRDNYAHAVHFVICNRAGDLVAVDLQNSHHEDFNSLDLKTVEGCDQLVLKRIIKEATVKDMKD